ncbi:hypothetical protein N9E03_01155 [bacterium]|jgi:hypothetical protein|nr:hypothetical protein [bacterium]
MSIQNNDLIDLIQSTFSVDQYKSKIGDDKNVVVLAFEVKDADPAKDLSQFIETGHDCIDVDVSPGPDKDGNYKVFVELQRNSKLFDSIDNILKDITRIDESANNFMFNAYKSDMPSNWNRQNFESSVYSSSYDYEMATNPEAQEISERIKFLNKY